MISPDSSSTAGGRSLGREWVVVAVVCLVVASTVTIGIGSLALATPDATDDATGIDGDQDVASNQDRSLLEGRLDVTDANTTFRGEATNDTFGAALANVGDLNGDGVDDVAIGAPENDTGGVDAGAVFVFYGPVSESDLNASQANVTIYGNQSFAKAGEAIAGADVDGDNDTELVVGAPGDNDGGVGAGAAYVLDAGVDFAANATDDRAPANASLANASTKLVGEGARDRAGTSVAGVGNRTDGEPDSVLVGAPLNDTAGTNAGAAYLVETVAEGTSSLGDATTFLGEGERDRAGHAVATAGDFDGDGAHDLLVGAYRNDSTDTNAGAAYVVSTNGTFDAEQSLASADVKLVGAAFRDGAGYAVSDAGDVDDDGYDDVVVGAPFNDTNGNQAGVAYVVTGGPDVEGSVALNASALVLYGEAEGDRAGWSVSSAGSGDVTCDAYADVLVGAPGHDVAVETPWNESESDPIGNASTIENAGSAYIVAGDETLDGARNLSDAHATIRGAAEGEQVGWTVTDVGNATDDRTADVLVGAPFADATANDSGAAYLFDGQCVAPEPEPEPTTTTTPTTTEPAEPPVVRAESRECEQLTLQNPSSNDQKVRFYVTPEDGRERGPFTLAPGEHGTFADVPPGEYTIRVETKRGGDAVLKGSGDSTDVVRVDECPKPEPEPKGSIRDVSCDDVAIAVRDVAEQEVTVQVRFADGTTTREIVETDADGDFIGDVDFENQRGKSVTAVRLFAGAGVDGEEIDRVSNLEIVCREPAPEPSGVIRDVTCNAVSISVADVPDRQVTVFVRFDDGSVTRRIVGIGADGEFSGDVRFANPRDKNVSAVFLFAGRGSDGEELDRVTRLDVTCREPEPEPEPEPAGSIRDVSCDAVTVRTADVAAGAITVQVRFADGSTTTATTETDADGDFRGEVTFDNPDDKTIAAARLFAGEDVDGEELDRVTGLNVQCREPEPEPEPEPSGEIIDVTCENVRVDASDVDADEVTVQVKFEDGSSTNASVELDDGEFDGEIAFDNPEDKNVTRVQLFAGSDASGEVLDDSGRIEVQCREPEPEPEPEPSGELGEVTCENVSVDASDVDAEEVTVQVRFEDGSTTNASAPVTDGAFAGVIEFENPGSENVTRVRLYAGSPDDGALLDDTGRIEVQCREPEPEPEPEPSGELGEVTCGNLSVDASDVDAEEVTVQVRFEDGSTNTATAELDDGEFDGEIPFDNPDDKNVTRVQLYAGSDTAGEILDDTGRIDVTCREPEPEPEPEPAGSIRDVSCGEVSVEASDVDAESVTVLVRLEDGSTVNGSAPVAGGAFDGDIAFDNLDDQNVTRVQLYAGGPDDGELLDDTGRIDVACREPVPEPTGVIEAVACENVTVNASNVSAENVTVLVRFADGSTTNASVPVTDGAFEGDVPFENPEDLNVTRVQLYAGNESTGVLLNDTGPIEVTCRQPAPAPTGAIERVTCENVNVTTANVTAANVTVLVDFEDGTNATANASVEDGAFAGNITYENPASKNVTRVRLYAGNETTGVLLNDTGPIAVTCQRPFSPTAEFRDDCREFYVSEHDDLTRVVLNFTDGTNQTFADIPTDREEWTYLGSGASEGKQIANATVFRDGESVRYESECPFVPVEDVLVSQDCDDEQGAVRFVNPNDVPVNVTFDGEVYPLAANGTVAADGFGEDGFADDVVGDNVTIDDLDDGDYEWRAVAEDGRLVGNGTITIECDEPPATTTEAPATTTEAPATTTEPPATTTEEPMTTTEEPMTTSEEPMTTSEEPFTTTEEPMTTSEEPMTTSEEPMTTSEEPFTTTEESMTTEEGTTESGEPPEEGGGPFAVLAGMVAAGAVAWRVVAR